MELIYSFQVTILADDEDSRDLAEWIKGSPVKDMFTVSHSEDEGKPVIEFMAHIEAFPFAALWELYLCDEERVDLKKKLQ